MNTVIPALVNWYDAMSVDLPEDMTAAGRVQIRKIEVRNGLENLRLSFQGRQCTPGTYTALYRNGTLWMSDTDAERLDHRGAARAIQRSGGRVLIGGLGLGMIVRVALLADKVEHVDIVEIDPDVAALVGSHYEAMAKERGKTLAIHVGDVFAMKWPAGSRWDVAWFDVWPDLCTDNLESMARLRRSYGRRSGWCECWGRELLLRHKRRGR